MDIPSATVWTDGFTAVTSGDGAISYSGSVATLSSGLSTGAAYLQKIVQSRPGEVLTFSIFARRTSGTDDETAPALKVEWPEDSSGQQSVLYVTSTDWREYEVSIGAGLTETGVEHFNIAVGVFTDDQGAVQISQPRLKLTNTGKGAARVHAYGLVKFTAGVPTLDADYVSSGITNLAYDGAGKLTLTTPRGITAITAGAGPLMQAQLMSDNAATSHLAARIGNFQRGTGLCEVKFYDTTTGTLTDISAIAGSFYVSVLLVV